VYLSYVVPWLRVGGHRIDGARCPLPGFWELVLGVQGVQSLVLLQMRVGVTRQLESTSLLAFAEDEELRLLLNHSLQYIATEFSTRSRLASALQRALVGVQSSVHGGDVRCECVTLSRANQDGQSLTRSNAGIHSGASSI